MTSQNDQNGTFGYPIIQDRLEENQRLHKYQQNPNLAMSGTSAGKGPVGMANDVNSNNLAMVSEQSAEPQANGRASRPSRKAVTFGKRSNSMRRNPKAEVSKQGWLCKQASSGVKQWNKRWFVLSDRCLFYYKDDKEETVLGSLPLLSFRIAAVQPADNISRKYAFKAEHAGIRTYYFSAESLEELDGWVRAMSEAARMHIDHVQRNNSENPVTTPKGTDPHMPTDPDVLKSDPRQEHRRELKQEVNGVGSVGPAAPSPLTTDMESRGGAAQPNGWSHYGTPAYPSQEGAEPRENVVLRRGFVPRTQPERVAQRKSSMTQLQQWVNQRRSMTTQEDLRSPSHYYTVNRGMSADYCGMYGGPPYVEEFPLYPPGVRPDSICSVSGGFDRLPQPRWAADERRRSLRDGPAYSREPSWAIPTSAHPGYYSQLETAQNSMRRLSMQQQPRSRSVPRSPSASSSQGACSPGPRDFSSPVRSPSARFDRGGVTRQRDDYIYADPSVYGLRRSISSPKYDYAGDRRSISQVGMYHYRYPGSPSLHDKMVPPFHDVYRDIPPMFKVNELEISKLLSRLCEQNRLLKDEEGAVQRLRMDKDNLEAALVATHQDLELYRNQPMAISKLQLKKETLQNQLINIRGELSQASSALATSRVEFDALEDEVNAVHGDLWEQLNAGGQNELLHRHIQKEFWRIQDVLEGLHKNNPSRGTDTAKHRVTSGASGSFSTNSPASPLSSVSVTSPLSPFSPVPGSQASPTKMGAMEDIGPPRPPLPKFYHPLESPPSPLPSVPPMPLENSAWHRTGGSLSGGLEDGYVEDFRNRQHKFSYQSDCVSAEKTNGIHRPDPEQDRQTVNNKVGVVPPRTKSPAEDELNSYDTTHRRNGKVLNGISKERPKSAVFPAEMRSKMSVEEQNERIKRNQSSSMREKRRSLNLSSSQQIDGLKPSTNYRVVRRRLTAHEVDIKDLEAAVRGEGVESPREEIARLRRLQLEPGLYDHDISKELSAPEKVLIPERYLDLEPSTPLSPEEEREKQKKVERIKTLIAKSNMQNVVPLLDGPTEIHADPEQQLHEQEKRIEISCALAAEASRRSRMLSGEEASPSKSAEAPLGAHRHSPQPTVPSPSHACE